MLVALLLGCGQAAPPGPAIDVADVNAAYDRVVNPIPAPPPEPSPIGAAVESYLDAAAADAEKPRAEVLMLTATWCGPCKSAKAKIVPWLEGKGYDVLIEDVSDFSAEEIDKAYGVTSLPTFIFRDGKSNVKITGPRYDTKGNPYAPDFKAAFDAFPVSRDNAVSFGMSVPAISVSDLTESVRGMDQDLFGVVHVTVPKDVSWTVEHRPASVVLTFTKGKQPSLRSLKYIRANPNLVSVEISPKWAEFKTDSYWPMLKTVRVDFDWSPQGMKPIQYRRYPQRQPYYYRPSVPTPAPVPQKPKPVVEDKPAPPQEPVTLGKGSHAIVPIAGAWRSTVCVKTTDEQVVYNMLGVPSLKKCEGCGSGVIVSSDGRILTNAHVIEGAKSIEVEFCDGQERTATVVHVDGKADLAVIQVPGRDLPTVKWSTGPPMVGSDVYLTGNPLGYGHSVSRGIVSGLNRDLNTGHGDHTGLMQVDAATNPGNSGGPVVSAKGEVLGIMVCMNSSGQGLSFCIPTVDVQSFLASVP